MKLIRGGRGYREYRADRTYLQARMFRVYITPYEGSAKYLVEIEFFDENIVAQYHVSANYEILQNRIRVTNRKSAIWVEEGRKYKYPVPRHTDGTVTSDLLAAISTEIQGAVDGSTKKVILWLVRSLM